MTLSVAATGWRGAATRTAALSGWWRAAVLAGLGALTTLTLPPIHLVPLLWVGFSGLALMLDGARSRRRAFLDGFWFGWTHCATGIYWIANAMLVDPEKFAWMIPFAVLGLGAVMAIYLALTTLLAWSIAPQGIARVLALAAAWGLLEWLRGMLFTGFPWNLIGTAWAETLPVSQIVSVIGAYGLSVLTVAVAAMPASLIRPGRTGVVATSASVAVLALVALWGWARIPDAPMATVAGVKLRLVQASILQRDKWEPSNRTKELLAHIELTRSPGYESITDVVWAETATPYFIDQDEQARLVLANAAPRGGLLITGAPRATPPDKEPFQIWNSMEAVDDKGTIVATFDKVHLVPFGEYMPLRNILPLTKLTAGGTDFTPGPGQRTLTLPGLPPVSPLICYEGIFPGAVLDPDHRPRWLLNITNDGWFGISPGPYQHFAASRTRAIEEGLPLVRDGNTGITAIVDPYGRITGSLELGTRGVLDGMLPEPLDGLTPFARWGNKIPLAIMALVGLAAFLLGRRTPAS